MLNQVSWNTYLEIVILLAAIYYIFVLFRYYGGDIRRLVQPAPGEAVANRTPEALRFEQREAGPVARAEPRHETVQPVVQDEALEETAELLGHLKQCILNASGKPFAPAVLIPQIKKLFMENPQMQHSPHRQTINELVVQECERTGTALLTEDEVDEWWSDQ